MMPTNEEKPKMLKFLFSADRTPLNIVNLVAGLGLLISPWLLSFTAEAYAAWNGWIVGAAICLIAIAALCALSEGEEWANLVLGIWAVVAPWSLGFSVITAAMWAHVLPGIIVAALAAGSIWFSHNRPFSAA